MKLYEIRNLYKEYKIGNKEKIFVLTNINLSLPNKGLVCIKGKSGCGKSTFLNMLTLLDSPSRGEVIYKGKNISKFSYKEKSDYLLNEIGIVFQHYHLIEEETVLNNIILPLLMSGVKKKTAIQKAKVLSKKFGFNEEFLKKKSSKLSGGEKQRVAIIRCLIKEPAAIFADEPTGALDSKNSENVMSLLKEISKTKLVAVVSHNDYLVDKYADEIVCIRDGKIISSSIKNVNYGNIDTFRRGKRSSSWYLSLVGTNIKTRFKTNTFSILGYSFCLMMTFLTIGFSIGNKAAIKNESHKQLDYHSMTISKETKTSSGNSLISISQISRPTEKEMNDFVKTNNEFTYGYNYSYFLNGSHLTYKNETLNELAFSPILNFDCVNEKPILGEIPKNNSFHDVVINKTAYEQLKQIIKGDIVNAQINIYGNFPVTYFDDILEKEIEDNLVMDTKLRIKAVVDDFFFLASSKIYYSYQGLEDYFYNLIAVNTSSIKKEDVSWYEILSSIKGNKEITNYSYQLFYQGNNYLTKEYIDNLGFEITNPSIERENAFSSLMDIVSMGLFLFLSIIIIGTIFVAGLISFYSYTEDKKKIAILSAIGARNNDIEDIYITENLFFALSGLIISFILSPLIERLINHILFNWLGLNGLIDLSWNYYFNIPYFIPITTFLIVVVISILSSITPLFFSKRIAIKEELKAL